MIKRFSLLSSALLLAFSCNSSTKTLSTTSTEKVRAGKKFVVNIKSNPTTGYGWKWANKDEAAADSVGHKYVADENKSLMVGSGGTEEWTFKAKKSGADSLVFFYVRPWEQDAVPADTMVFHFKVK